MTSSGSGWSTSVASRSRSAIPIAYPAHNESRAPQTTRLERGRSVVVELERLHEIVADDRDIAVLRTDHPAGRVVDEPRADLAVRDERLPLHREELQPLGELRRQPDEPPVQAVQLGVTGE